MKTHQVPSDPHIVLALRNHDPALYHAEVIFSGSIDRDRPDDYLPDALQRTFKLSHPTYAIGWWDRMAAEGCTDPEPDWQVEIEMGFEHVIHQDDARRPSTIHATEGAIPECSNAPLLYLSELDKSPVAICITGSDPMVTVVFWMTDDALFAHAVSLTRNEVEFERRQAESNQRHALRSAPIAFPETLEALVSPADFHPDRTLWKLATEVYAGHMQTPAVHLSADCAKLEAIGIVLVALNQESQERYRTALASWARMPHPNHAGAEMVPPHSLDLQSKLVLDRLDESIEQIRDTSNIETILSTGPDKFTIKEVILSLLHASFGISILLKGEDSNNLVSYFQDVIRAYGEMMAEYRQTGAPPPPTNVSHTDVSRPIPSDAIAADYAAMHRRLTSSTD